MICNRPGSDMDKYSKKMLNRLLDKYEKSKSFTEDNVKNQNFYLYISREFPKYDDDSDYDTFMAVNDAIAELEDAGYIGVDRKKSGIVSRIRLNVLQLAFIYQSAARTPKIEENKWLEAVLTNWIKNQEENQLLHRYAVSQLRRIAENKGVECYSGNRHEYEDILKAFQYVSNNEKESFIRDVSIDLFGDSKRFGQIQRKVQTLLYQYGDFEERESVLEECGVVKTPTYVMMKGNAVLKFQNQSIYLSKLKGDIALSTKTMEELESVEILGGRVITIENLTTFHDYCGKEDFCIYLGGFHNKLKEKFIKKIYEQNTGKYYFHFGDIDAGGFYIYEHLVHKTGIYFETLYMGIEALEKHKEAWKKLTDNDRKRISKLIGNLDKKEKAGVRCTDYRNTLQYMLTWNCKLEQEALM